MKQELAIAFLAVAIHNLIGVRQGCVCARACVDTACIAILYMFAGRSRTCAPMGMARRVEMVKPLSLSSNVHEVSLVRDVSRIRGRGGRSGRKEREGVGR